VTDTVLRDSTYAAIQFLGSSVSNVQVVRSRIEHPGTFGLQVQANGGVSVANVTATRVGARQGIYICPTANKFKIAGKVKGLNGRYCGPFPKPR
jgi:hypothetical protein